MHARRESAIDSDHRGSSPADRAAGRARSENTDELPERGEVGRDLADQVAFDGRLASHFADGDVVVARRRYPAEQLLPGFRRAEVLMSYSPENVWTRTQLITSPVTNLQLVALAAEI